MTISTEAVRWTPGRTPPAPSVPRPPLRAGLWRGARNRCPACGEGQLFQGYLKPVAKCAACAAPLGDIRADDAPPYFTIFITGKLMITPIMLVEKLYFPPIWVHMALWLPLVALVTILLLRPVKGATVGLMAHLGITGREHGPGGMSAEVLRPGRGGGD